MSNTENYDFEALSVGSEGGLVLMVQRTLCSIGYELDSNGVFDEHMQEIVKEFQEEQALPVPNGEVGVETILELERLDSLNK
jgi:N-acetyl-anhydromuramyl-L-alanine amidase AmpD